MPRRRPPAVTLIALVVGAIFGVLALSAHAEESPLRDVPAHADRIDFAQQIEPILKRECYDCHGPGGASGGLNLTSKKLATFGGDSGGRVLGGPLQTNVLWERVATKDADYRMPKGGRLSDEELGLLRAWIEQGSAWPVVTLPTSTGEADWPQPIDAIKMTGKKHAVLLVVLLVLLLIAVRLQALYKAGHPFATGKGKALTGVLRHLRFEHVLLVFLALVSLDLMSVTRRQVARAESLTDHVSVQRGDSPLYTYFFGDPPKPYRPDVPKTVDATYWRGNCERNDDLFNGGRYRTSTLHLSLCGADRTPLGIGDAVPEEGLLVRFDIKRAPNTANTMYGAEMMARVFADQSWYTGRIRELKRDPILLETVKEDWSWSAFIPVEVAGDGTHHALWYVYQNLRQDGVPFTPKVHLGIDMTVVVVDGRIAEGSDLWLGNLFWNPSMEPPPRKFDLPLADWLHHEPIPAIPDGHPHHDKRAGK